MALQVYRASAGSGKTYTLTLEFFKIVFAAPLEYRNVLAVTFTNKATGEMKSRIVKELHALAEGERTSYGEALERELGLAAEEVKLRAGILRTLVLHDYGRLSVTTIDKFFQRILKSFTRELGIFPGYNVELDSEYVLLQAVDQVMRRLNEDADLRAWVNDLMNTSVEESHSWNVKMKINELGKDLFGETYILLPEELKRKFNDRPFLRGYRTFLRGVMERFDRQLRDYGETACRLLADNDLQPSDFKGSSRSFAHHFTKLREGAVDKISPTVRKAADNAEEWSTKTTPPAKRAAIEGIFPELNRCLRESIAFFDEQWPAYNSARFLLDVLYQLGILQDLYQEVRGYCDEKGLMLLSDTTRLLNALIAGNDAPFLFEKTGNFYKHVMIDEFQDTSAMQWANFRPLVQNTLAEGGRALVVGDVKQSIYRWRNGDWKLLAGGLKQELTGSYIQDLVLENNWRSARTIVDFNNRVFDMAPRMLAELFDRECGGENPYSSSIIDAYAGQRQNVRKKREGYLEIRFGGEQREEESQRAILQNMVEIIQDILERGGRLQDCVILVRGTSEGEAVANYLMEYNKTEGVARPIRFLSNDSLYVAASPYVELIVDVLRYLTEPYDAVNRAILIYHLRIHVQADASFSLDDLFKAAADPGVFAGAVGIPWLDTAETFSPASLYELVEEIIDVFGLKGRPEEVPYLIAFQDIVYNYETNNTNSLPAFLEWWEKEREYQVLSTSEASDAVRILTIHKSKGLEFGTVILPFCAWELDGTRHRRRLWCTNRVEGFNALEKAPLNYSSRLVDTYFKEDYLEEHMKAYVDNLNLLYVALTRAERELYVLPYAPKAKTDGRPANLGAFLFQVLERLAADGQLPAWCPDEGVLRMGTREEFVPDVSSSLDDTLSLAAYPICHLRDRVSVRYLHEDYAPMALPAHSPVDEGKLLHEIFRRIDTVSDISSAIAGVYHAGLLAATEREYYDSLVSRYLANAPVEWFNGSYHLVNERDILLPGNSKVRPDRVMLNGDEAIVVDYKFGQRQETAYVRQMNYYCRLLRQMGYSRVVGYIWYVTLNQIVAL